MSHVTWTLPDGRRIAADVKVDTNLMEAALAHGVPGVVGECGGCLSCATCHVVVAPEWAERAGPPGEHEAVMLDIVESRGTHSRLSCQLVASDALDGLVLMVPAG